NQIIYHAVSKDEPPGKQLDKIKTVSVKLTISHPEDAEIIEKKRYTCTEAAQNDAFCNRSIRSG
ncbi:MAG: DUF1670 domain-containing protein, partial [Euryarchaeota archaeon]|nr:DUF1670 domain-containing protein [Euryarchaeota archaeon]